jgi:DNA-dependent ATPase I and helicase II
MNDFQKIFEKNYKMLNADQKEAVDTIDGPVLVIAGPGTGKTQLLSTRIANILQKTDTAPENILAMTFTEAGASNMRERLSRFIGTDSFKVGIFTYHGFANEIIQNYREYFTDKNLNEAADELVTKEIITKISNELPSSSKLKKISISNIASTIKEMKNAYISPDDLRKVAKANISEQEIFNESIKGLRVDGRTFAKVQPFYSAIRENLENSISKDLNNTKFESNLYFYFEKLNEAYLEAEETGKSKPLTDWKNTFLDLKDFEDNFQISDTYANKKLLEFADFYEKFNNEMKNRGLYDFNDMILEVIETLEDNDDFRFTLQEKYQYLLLDEYQDTNDSQAKIIELLTNNPVMEGKPNVLAVGDDDQAIMAFQGASKSNMIDFYNRFGENTKVINLTKNYRSHGDILTASKNVANTISGRLTKNLPIKIEKDISAEGSFIDRKIQLERTNFESQIAEFSWVAEKISNLIRNGVTPKEIAVIAPKHKILQAFVPYLKNQNVPIYYEKRENILKNEIISQLIKISKLILAIRDKDEDRMANLFPEVLSFDFWQIPAVEIWKMSWAAKDNRDFWIEAILKSEVEQIRNLGEILVTLAEFSHEKTFEELFDYILGSREIREGLKSPIRDFISQKSDEEFYDTILNLTILRDKLREFSNEENNKLDILINYVELCEEFEIQILSTNPHNTSENAVQVMTPFVAKGLEFEYTFLISLNQDSWNSAKKGGGGENITMPANLKFTNIEDEGEDTRKRLMFVAMTRAKTQLYLTNHNSDLTGKTKKTLSFLDEREEDGVLKSKILPEKWQEVSKIQRESLEADEIETNWHEFYTIKNEKMRELLKPRVKNYKLSPTDLNSYTSLQYKGPQTFFENKILCFPGAYGPALTLGNIVHEGFNYIQDEINSGNTPNIDNIKKYAIERFSKYPLSEKDKEEILERFNQIFENFFENNLGEFKPGNIAEKNFSGVGVTIGNAVLTGKIDLIRIDSENKKITVVDYKTGSIPFNTKTNKFDTNSTKIHEYTQQLYFYKILIENAPEFPGYTVEKGILEFIEPDKRTEKTYNFEVIFKPEEEERLKTLIQAVWVKIKSFDFKLDEEKYSKDVKGTRAFEADLIAGFKESNN